MKENKEGNSQVISENIIQESSHTFRGLEENNRYIVKLQAVGSQELTPAGGEGSKGREISIIHDARSPQPPGAANPLNTATTDSTPANASDDIVDAPPLIVTDLLEYEADEISPSTTHGHDKLSVDDSAVPGEGDTKHDEADFSTKPDDNEIPQEVHEDHVEGENVTPEIDPAGRWAVCDDTADQAMSNLDDTAELSTPVVASSDQLPPKQEDDVSMHRTAIDIEQ